MQKLLVGCLVLVVLGAIGLGLVAYFGYRAAQPALEQAREYVSGLGQLSELSDLDADVANTASFTPAAGGELTTAQVDAFVRVQRHVRETLGTRMDEIEAKYHGLGGGSNDAPSPREMLAALSDVAGLFVDARRAQVDALNAQGLSQEEYDWVRRSFYAAAGVEAASGIDLGRIEEMARDGAARAGIDPADVPRPDVPEANRQLVAPHLDEMKAWLPLAFFGL